MKVEDSTKPMEKPTETRNRGSAAASFADVARLITGDEPPPWLVDTLTRWGPSVVMARGVAILQPTRSEMTKRLGGVKDAAALIVNALNDGATRDFLDAGAPEKIPYHGQIDRMLRDLVRRGEEGVALLAAADGKTKAGRNKALPPGYFPPKTFCAAIIAEAWSFIHGAEPAPKNKEAAAAADLYWRVLIDDLRIEPTKEPLDRIIAKEAKSWGNRLNGWRRHFEQAREPAVSNIREDIRRHLVEDKRWPELLAGDKPG
jgi:hypothetical protein